METQRLRVIYIGYTHPVGHTYLHSLKATCTQSRLHIFELHGVSQFVNTQRTTTTILRHPWVFIKWEPRWLCTCRTCVPLMTFIPVEGLELL